MGKKKDKKERKQIGSQKTALKTEKKNEKKTKKMLQERGEEDIELMIAHFQEQDRKRQQVVEEKCPPPSPRCNMTLTAHPDKDILMMFGGEYYDGSRTYLYNDLFLYNIKTGDWSLLKAPNAPAPRCSHQAVALAQLGGQLWIFGGEFASPTQSQFYHYKDLWLLNLKDNIWQKTTAPGGPTSRSGHRMAACQKILLVFGGFHESTNDYRYYNDIHAFNTETYRWLKLDVSGIPPSPRSACVMAVTHDHSQLIVYGGYSKDRVKRDVDHGQVHCDMFALAFDSRARRLAGDEAGSDKVRVTWKQVKQSGCRPSPRSSCSLVTTAPDVALLFGGVYDVEEDEESVKGVFYNEMFALELDKGRWHQQLLRKQPSERDVRRRRRRKLAADEKDAAAATDGVVNDDDDDDDDDDVHDGVNGSMKCEDVDKEIERLAVKEVTDSPAVEPSASTVTSFDDGIFTVTFASPQSNACASDVPETVCCTDTDCFMPCPRMNPLLCVRHGTLFLYGGVYEAGDRQVTLSDFYSLDIHKMDEWKTIIPLDTSTQEWLESESSSDEEQVEMETAVEGATAGASCLVAESDDDDDDDDSDDRSLSGEEVDCKESTVTASST